MDGQVLSRHPTSLLPGEGFLGLRKAPRRSSGLAGPRERPSGPPSRAGQPIKLDLTFLAPAHAQMSLDSCRDSLDLPAVPLFTGSSRRPSGARVFPRLLGNPTARPWPRLPLRSPRGCHSGDRRGAAWWQARISQWPRFQLPLTLCSPSEHVVVAQGVGARSWHPSYLNVQEASGYL